MSDTSTPTQRPEPEKVLATCCGPSPLCRCADSFKDPGDLGF